MVITRRVQKKKKKHYVLGAAAILFLIASILIVANFETIQSYFANQLQQTELSSAKSNKQNKKPSYDLNAVKPISPDTLASAWRNRHDYRAVGQIAIDHVNICLNIYRGVGNDELALGAGTFRKNQKMGHNNYPLAGHNMDDGKTYFSPLYTAKVTGNLKNGTPIFITDFKKVYYYKITGSEFIGVNNLKLSYNQKKYERRPVVTLFTCDWTGQGRLYVVASLTGSQSLKSASKYVRSRFNVR